MTLVHFCRKHLVEIITFGVFLIFSIWLMFSTFDYKDNSIFIASKAWSDFGSHIPLIRSFSYGENFPPQNPLFPGEAIRYHFLFYFLVAMLEKVGLPLNYALNIPSALGFFGLLVMLYIFSSTIFKSKVVGILTALFFVCSGSLSFLYFIQEHPLNKNFLPALIANEKFPSFAPYGPGIVSAFWNLNIYTNQRHFAAALALSLLLIYLLIKPLLKDHSVSIKTAILIGITLGLFFYFHLAVFIMTIITFSILAILFPKKLFIPIAISLTIGGLLSFPQYLYYKSAGVSFPIENVPGYLIFDRLSFTNFISYWFMNLGLHSILIPIGVIIASCINKKIFISFFVLFIIGNLFKFSPEIAANHKFFNYFMLIGTSYSAYVLVKLWNLHLLLKPLVIALTFFLIFSGIIELFPIYNDPKISIEDYPKNKDVAWVVENTPKTAVFFNSNYLYNPESIAGRKVFMGWPYFAWSAGHDTYGRYDQMKQFFAMTDHNMMCQFLSQHKLDYVSITKPNNEFSYDLNFWATNFQPIYKSPTTDLVIYSRQNICQSS